MHIRYRFLIEDRDRHGTVRVYYRRNGRKIRIREERGSVEFAERYTFLHQQFESGTFVSPAPTLQRPAPGTFGWLVRAYETSPAFLALDPTTQRTRTGISTHMLDEPVFKGADETYRNFPLPRLGLAALEVLRDRKAGKPEAANNRVRVLRALFKWAADKKHVAVNPALALARVKNQSDGFHTWSVEEIAQFEARHPPGTKANLALRLMLYTGARRSDATRIGRQHWRGGSLTWTAYKNRNRHPVTLDVPVLAPLAEAIAAGPTGDMVFLVTEYGKPFAIAGFGNWFRERCNEAGLPQCSAHGLRKAGSTLAAEAGATAHQLMSMYGWRSLAEAERYTKAAERKRMAASGMGLILTGIGQRTAPTVPLSKSGESK